MAFPVIWSWSAMAEYTLPDCQYPIPLNSPVAVFSCGIMVFIASCAILIRSVLSLKLENFWAVSVQSGIELGWSNTYSPFCVDAQVLSSCQTYKSEQIDLQHSRCYREEKKGGVNEYHLPLGICIFIKTRLGAETTTITRPSAIAQMRSNLHNNTTARPCHNHTACCESRKFHQALLYQRIPVSYSTSGVGQVGTRTVGIRQHDIPLPLATCWSELTPHQICCQTQPRLILPHSITSPWCIVCICS